MQEGLHSLERETGSWSEETEVTDARRSRCGRSISSTAARPPVHADADLGALALGFTVLAHVFRV